MLEFTAEQVKIYLIGSIIFTIIYIIIYNKGGQERNFMGYKRAIQHCLTYAVIGIFLIIGVEIIKKATPIYEALIYFILILIISYFVISAMLKEDFNININIIKLEPAKAKAIKRTSLILVFLVTFGVAAAFMFWAAFDTEQIYARIALIIGGVIFGLVSLICLFTLLGKTKKILQKINIFSLFLIIYCIFAVLFGILFLTAGVGKISEFKEKEKTYMEVQGQYEGYKIASNGDTTTYYYIYSYKVDGKTYLVSKNAASNVKKSRRYDKNLI